MRIAVLYVALWGATIGASGQSVVAAIQGVVSDSSGAVIQNATLTLTNLEENTRSIAQSGPQGLYQFLNLNPGRYEIQAEREGFASTQTSVILVGARETRRADLTLSVAAGTESLEVRATVPLITTENGTVSDSKSFEQIISLPTNFRAPDSSLYQILSIFPGIQSDEGQRFSVGGGLPAQADYTIDGISNADIRRFGPLFFSTPSPEMLSEVRVTSVGASAAYGSMGDVTISSKSGTNQFHGSLLWYHQNFALDAIPYGSSKGQKIYNNFGASLGGPVLFPRSYDGRNRTFFFADYEGTRKPQSLSYTLNVPTARMREGFLDGVPGPAALDPATGAPFPDNRIPVTSINPVTRRLLEKYYPLPNVTTPGASYNYSAATRADVNSNRYDIRVDHVISSRQRVSVRWGNGTSDVYILNFLPLPESRANPSNRILNAPHIFSSSANWSNEFRAGLTLYTNQESFPIRGEDAVADLGLVGLNLQNAAGIGGFPAFQFASSAFASIGHPREMDDRSRTFQFADTLTLVRGSHTYAFGADFRRIGYHAALSAWAQGFSGDDFGTFVFSDNFYTRNGFADFLLGIPSQTGYVVLGPNIDESSRHTALFAQDNWRITPRLTLQMGLRWEVHPPMHEEAGNIATFDRSTASVIVPDQTVGAAPGFLKSINACTVSDTPSCTKVLTASQAGLPQNLRRTDYGDWAPRIGFAWQPQALRKTIVRGAAGIYTQTLRGQVARANAGVYSSDIRTIPNSLTPAGQPLVSLPNILPQPAALGNIGIQNFLSGIDPNLRDPRSYQWSLTVEREMPWNTSVRASYIGVQSVGMPVLADYNQVAPSATPYTSTQKPFPNWGRLNSIENLGFAKYHGLQLEANHRFQNRLSFQASYILGKNVGMMGAPVAFGQHIPNELNSLTVTDRFNTRYDRGELDGTRRHRFVLTGLFPLPAFQSGSAALRAFFDGWELSTVTLLESGVFQTPVMSPAFDQSNTSVPARSVRARPDRVSDGNLPNPTRDQYYSLAAFTPPPAGSGRFGNAGAGILEGPGTVAIAGGLSKTFHLAESARLRFEATFTNIPNHPNFYPPSVNINDQSNFGKLLFARSGENTGARTGQFGIRIDF